MACGFAGNPDVYGIGIRIGYYTQALAVWFSNYFFFREAIGLRAANHLFLFALVIVGFIYTYNARTTYAIEAFLLLQVGLCIAFVSIMESTRFSSKYMRTSGQRLALRTVIINAGLLFNVCFWWRGLDIMLSTPCDGTGTIHNQGPSDSTYACYAFRADIYGWMRTLMEVLSLASLVWTTLQATGRDAGELLQRLRMKQAKTSFINYNPTEKVVASVNPKSTVTPQQDREKTRLEEAILQPLEEIGLPESVRSPLPPEGSITFANQDAASKRDEYDSASKRGLEKSDCITYGRIRDAEVYLNSIFSLYTENTARMGTKRLLHLFNGRIHIYIPRLPHRRNPHSVRYTRCLWTAMKSTWINKPPMDLRWRVALHMAALGQHPPWRWPRFLYHMCQINETREPPHWHLLAIASDIQLSQIPLTITPQVWTFMAIGNLFTIIALIVQVELTIAWNHISGLQNLNTLGQLIPFIIGVGGLLKVLWGKWCMVRKGVREGPREEGCRLGEYEAAIGRYLKWREGVEKEVTAPASGPERTAISPL